MKKIDKYTQVSSLWLTYRDQLTGYIFKKVKSKDLADDIAHEVLMKIYDSCCSGHEIKNVRSWMYQIAHNTLIDHFKKESKFTDRVIVLSEDEENNVYQEAADFVASFITLLPEKYGNALRLSDIEGLKQAEVAEKVNLSLSATKSRIQRARVLLKEKILECSRVELDDQGRLKGLDIKPGCGPLSKK